MDRLFRRAAMLLTKRVVEAVQDSYPTLLITDKPIRVSFEAVGDTGDTLATATFANWKNRKTPQFVRFIIAPDGDVDVDMGPKIDIGGYYFSGTLVIITNFRNYQIDSEDDMAVLHCVKSSLGNFVVPAGMGESLPDYLEHAHLATRRLFLQENPPEFFPVASLLKSHTA